MTLNETITAIQYAKDLDAENNVKLFIMGVVLIYSIVMLYMSYKWDTTYMWQDIIKWLLMRIPTSVILFFSPLGAIYLFRTVSWEELYLLVIAAFSYTFIILMIAGVMGMFTWALSYFGLENTFSKMEIKKKW